MTPIDLSKLPDYLRAQRWFNGKAWPIKSVEVADHANLEFEGKPFMLAIVEVLYELGTPERYLLPVSPAGGAIKDALEEPEFLRGIFDLVRRQDTVTAGTGKLVGEWLPTREEEPAITEPVSVRRLHVEQSNTSVVLGEKVILKIIRKLETGISPEHEVGRFLATQTRFRAMPPLVGALHLEGGPAAATLAIAHHFVPSAVDGWKHTLEIFRRSATPQPAFLAEMGELGARLGELHTALASRMEDPAFSPEPVLQEDLQRWSASIMGELGVTLADAARVDGALEARRDLLLEEARKLGRLEPSGQKIRIHGDLHLGQVMRAGPGWLIFDFEGEPARNFTQRREKYSPLKDVAGMLRSFDYAAATVTLEGGQGAGHLQPVSEAFIEGYRSATRGATFLPATEEAFRVTLRAFELEKLLYEVRYELQNRPDWVRIPIQALLRMEVAS